MIIRTCLVISEDPDDHIEFSEALYEISDDIVVISVSDVRKAVDLLMLKRCIPDFIFLNGGIGDLEPDRFFGALNGEPLLKDVKVIAYGESMSLRSPRVTATIESDLSFSELKGALRRVTDRENDRAAEKPG